MAKVNPYISRYNKYCQGCSDTDRYMFALTVSVATVPMTFSTPWSENLDAIHAFDAAEIEGAHLGQINAIEVSSFCSQQGIIWGLEAARVPNLFENKLGKVRGLDVFDGEGLNRAAMSLFGENREKRFRLAPGTMCRIAKKLKVEKGSCILYGAVGLGLRSGVGVGDARPIMEDTGVFHPSFAERMTLEQRKNEVSMKVAESVAVLGEDHGVTYESILVMYREIFVPSNRMGCSLVLAPYFRIARDALPEDGIDGLKEMPLPDWESMALPRL